MDFAVQIYTFPMNSAPFFHTFPKKSLWKFSNKCDGCLPAPPQKQTHCVNYSMLWRGSNFCPGGYLECSPKKFGKRGS